MKPPKKTTAQSLLKKASSSGDIKSMSMDSGFRSWARSNELATAKEIDGMSKGQLESLYMKYLKAKGM
jgi:hypothetical protein